MKKLATQEKQILQLIRKHKIQQSIIKTLKGGTILEKDLVDIVSREAKKPIKTVENHLITLWYHSVIYFDINPKGQTGTYAVLSGLGEIISDKLFPSK